MAPLFVASRDVLSIEPSSHTTTWEQNSLERETILPIVVSSLKAGMHMTTLGPGFAGRISVSFRPTDAIEVMSSGLHDAYPKIEESAPQHLSQVSAKSRLSKMHQSRLFFSPT